MVTRRNNEGLRSGLIKGTAYLVIVLGFVGLISTLTLGVVVYKLGSSLGSTWDTAVEGLRRSSTTIGAAKHSVNDTREGVMELKQISEQTSTVMGITRQGLMALEQLTGDLTQSMMEIALVLDSTGKTLTPSGQVGQVSVSLEEAGKDAQEAALSAESLRVIWPHLPAEEAEIGEQFTKDFSTSLSSLSLLLEEASIALSPTGEVGRVGQPLSAAGAATRDGSQAATSLTPLWNQLGTEAVTIQNSVDAASGRLADLENSLTEMSQGLGEAEDTLGLIAADLEALGQSKLLPWVFVSVIVFFGVLSTGLILIGLFLLGTTNLPRPCHGQAG